MNYFDPVTDNPIDSEMEKLIDLIGEKRYLAELILKVGIRIDRPLDELTDHECRKALRAIFRNCKDYAGPEMKQ